MDIQYDILGKRIQLRRRELGIKQQDLAEQLNISNNHMSSIETGRAKPSLEVLLNICEILHVTPDFLLLDNMHADDISRDIMDGLNLCSSEDRDLTRRFIELLIERNPKNRNLTHFV